MALSFVLQEFTTVVASQPGDGCRVHHICRELNPVRRCAPHSARTLAHPRGEVASRVWRMVRRGGRVFGERVVRDARPVTPGMSGWGDLVRPSSGEADRYVFGPAMSLARATARSSVSSARGRRLTARGSIRFGRLATRWE